MLHYHGSATVTGVSAAGGRAVSCAADGSATCWAPADTDAGDGGGVTPLGPSQVPARLRIVVRPLSLASLLVAAAGPALCTFPFTLSWVPNK